VRRNLRVTRRGRMIASKASHATTRKTAIPARKTPGAGIMRSIVLALNGNARRRSGNQPRAHGDFRIVQFGDGTAGFRGFHRGVEFGFVRAGNIGDEIEMALGDGEAVSDLFERDRASGLQLRGGDSGAAELRGKSHGEAAGMRGRKQFFGIRADTVFEARAEGILRAFQRAAIGGNGTLTGFQVAVPYCGSVALRG